MVINFDNTITLKYAPIEYLKLNEKTYFIDANIAKINETSMIYLTTEMDKEIYKLLKL